MKICFGIKDYHTSKTGNLWYVWFSQNICLIYSIYAKHLGDYKGGIWIRLSELNYIIRMVAGHTIKEMSLILSFIRPFWVRVYLKKWRVIDGTECVSTWRFMYQALLFTIISVPFASWYPSSEVSGGNKAVLLTSLFKTSIN